MKIHITARHFKAPSELQRYAETAVYGLSQTYEGIVSADIVLEERPRGGGDKVAEVMLSVYREQLIAREASHDIKMSVQACVDKLERQLHRYKAKLHAGQRPGGNPGLAGE
ncbi:MAG: ribosome-associated translation inhibitor RaiA [Bacteroidetes bacterium]|nr:ribosome-associated translation inhibitor RaiA [Bacteroidota bacterium]